MSRAPTYLLERFFIYLALSAHFARNNSLSFLRIHSLKCFFEFFGSGFGHSQRKAMGDFKTTAAQLFLNRLAEFRKRNSLGVQARASQVGVDGRGNDLDDFNPVFQQVSERKRE